ncbi:unnamed protein product [Dicrocoelium dendriticum]|nr:unnamed protein product [Dicrocoelium dendriticum]
MYADNLKLWLEVSKLDDADLLQRTLDRLHCWSVERQLPINHAVFCPPNWCPGLLWCLSRWGASCSGTQPWKGILEFLSRQTYARLKTPQRNLPLLIGCSFSHMTLDIFRLLFSSHVRQILEYRLPGSYLHEKRMRTDKEVHRRGSKSVVTLRNLSYSNHLQRTNFFCLGSRRRRGALIYTRCILRSVMRDEVQEFSLFCADSSTRDHGMKLFKPRRFRVRSDVTLSTHVMNDWNSLPELVSMQTAESFQRLLDICLLEKHGSYSVHCDRNVLLCNTSHQLTCSLH